MTASLRQKFDCEPIFIPDELADQYYNGFANGYAHAINLTSAESFGLYFITCLKMWTLKRSTGTAMSRSINCLLGLFQALYAKGIKFGSMITTCYFYLNILQTFVSKGFHWGFSFIFLSRPLKSSGYFTVQ